MLVKGLQLCKVEMMLACGRRLIAWVASYNRLLLKNRHWQGNTGSNKSIPSFNVWCPTITWVCHQYFTRASWETSHIECWLLNMEWIFYCLAIFFFFFFFDRQYFLKQMKYYWCFSWTGNMTDSSLIMHKCHNSTKHTQITRSAKTLGSSLF